MTPRSSLPTISFLRIASIHYLYFFFQRLDIRTNETKDKRVRNKQNENWALQIREMAQLSISTRFDLFFPRDHPRSDRSIAVAVVVSPILLRNIWSVNSCHPDIPTHRLPHRFRLLLLLRGRQLEAEEPRNYVSPVALENVASEWVLAQAEAEQLRQSVSF